MVGDSEASLDWDAGAVDTEDPEAVLDNCDQLLSQLRKHSQSESRTDLSSTFKGSAAANWSPFGYLPPPAVLVQWDPSQRRLRSSSNSWNSDRLLELAKPIPKIDNRPTFTQNASWMRQDHVEEWYTMGAEGFRLHLQSKFGTTSCGWRFGLDPNHEGRLSLREFSIACRRVGYHGKIKSVMQEIGTICGDFVSFFQVDNEAAQMIADFIELIISRCGDIRVAWTKVSRETGGKVGEQQFDAFVKSLVGKDAHLLSDAFSAKHLFRLLRQNPSRRYLTLQDLVVWKMLDVVPPGDRSGVHPDHVPDSDAVELDPANLIEPGDQSDY